MSGHPNAITFYNRYTGETEVENVYGEGFLRWTYETMFGRLALRVLVKRAWFSRWYGWRMDRPASRGKVLPFIADYRLDTGEFADDATTFESFNEFFYRKLKPEARPIADASAVFPADGRHLAIPDLSAADRFWVKGQRLGLPELLGGDAALTEKYQHGAMLVSRLCPVDYHRFHFPVSGTAGHPRLINGHLSSVNPIALRRRLAILCENKRILTEIETDRMGTVLMLEIGATCVGGIEQSYAPGPVGKGDEKGYFKFGGSMTIVLFEPAAVVFSEDLRHWSGKQMEIYARMGDSVVLALSA